MKRPYKKPKPRVTNVVFTVTGIENDITFLLNIAGIELSYMAGINMTHETAVDAKSQIKLKFDILYCIASTAAKLVSVLGGHDVAPEPV